MKDKEIIKVNKKDVTTIKDNEILCILIKGDFAGLNNISPSGKMVVLDKEIAHRVSSFKDDMLNICFVCEDAIKVV